MREKYKFLFDSSGVKLSSRKITINLKNGNLDDLINDTNWLPEMTKIPERLYVYLNGLTEIPKCKHCKINIVKFWRYKYGYFDFCSTKCAVESDQSKESRRITNLEKFGVENPFQSEGIKEKIKLTNIEKYGVASPLQNTIINSKVTNTIKERYGVDNISKSIVFKDKKKNTYRERYNVDNYSQTDECKEKVKQTNIEKFGFEYFSQTEEYKESVRQINLEKYGADNFTKTHNPEAFALLENREWLEEQYDLYPAMIIAENIKVSHSTVSRYIKMHNIENYKWKGMSFLEKELLEFIQSIYSDEIITNSRNIINPKELDIYLPEKKLAIEFNGIYWHSSIDESKRGYHLNKTLECEKKGIQLLHVFENEWREKSDIWKSVIRNKLGLSEKIYARKCEIVVIERDDGYRFFQENHLQGGLQRGFYIGLYYQNELVSCISYGKSRFEKGVFEIYRFANKLNMSVIGGFSKLLKKLPKNIITYANRRWSNGDLYEKNGFELISTTPPNYFYVFNDELHNRIKYQKHKLKNMEFYSDDLTEEQIMQLNGYRRIYDCGNLKFKRVL